MRDKPNVLLIVSDQERQRDWLPEGLSLPNRQRLLDEGVEFAQYRTHTSPCSPSRGTIFTGQYMPVHGVAENCNSPASPSLEVGASTLGKRLRAAGYRTAFKGKWHLNHVPDPDIDAHGWGDWEGNDQAFWGQAGTGVEFDEPIASSAAAWLEANASDNEPWFLTVALVNPHDIMWFPIDQPFYQRANEGHTSIIRSVMDGLGWGRDDALPAFEEEYERWFTELPPNFDDDLHTKPDVHRRFAKEHAATGGFLDRSDTDGWLRMLDYYVKLHQMSDHSLGLVLDALDATGQVDETVVVFTSDHGEQCGAHGLRSKGPWNYEETMRVPLYIRAPGAGAAGSSTDAMFSHVDLAATIVHHAGADADGMPGHDMRACYVDQQAPGRSELLFAQDWAWYDNLLKTRYASRGIFDGRFKYCRYFGIGGSSTVSGREVVEEKVFGVDASFDDHDHELYDLQEDPHELVNLALDRSRREETRDWFHRLLSAETTEFEVESKWGQAQTPT